MKPTKQLRALTENSKLRRTEIRPKNHCGISSVRHTARTSRKMKRFEPQEARSCQEKAAQRALRQTRATVTHKFSLRFVENNCWEKNTDKSTTKIPSNSRTSTGSEIDFQEAL